MKTVRGLAERGMDLSLDFYMEFEDLFVKYARNHMEKIKDEEFGRMTIVAISQHNGFQNRMSLLKRLFSLRIPFVEDKSIAPGFPNKTVIDISKEKGIWDAYEALTLSTMGESLKNTVLGERDRIEALVAFSSNFLSQNKRCFERGTSEYSTMEQMTISLVNALEKRLPISEDLLFLLWKWSSQISGGHPLDSFLGKGLCKILNDILLIPLNAFKWTWFKANLLQSAVK